jgi:hypothetical protein
MNNNNQTLKTGYERLITLNKESRWLVFFDVQEDEK